jgi:hypothetical protein
LDLEKDLDLDLGSGSDSEKDLGWVRQKASQKEKATLEECLKVQVVLEQPG